MYVYVCVCVCVYVSVCVCVYVSVCVCVYVCASLLSLTPLHCRVVFTSHITIIHGCLCVDPRVNITQYIM